MYTGDLLFPFSNGDFSLSCVPALPAPRSSFPSEELRSQPSLCPSCSMFSSFLFFLFVSPQKRDSGAFLVGRVRRSVDAHHVALLLLTPVSKSSS